MQTYNFLYVRKRLRKPKELAKITHLHNIRSKIECRVKVSFNSKILYILIEDILIKWTHTLEDHILYSLKVQP